MSDPAARHSLRVHQFHGLRPGPRLLVLGAVHGNEVAGPLGIQRVLAELDRGALRITRGCATFVPVTNPLAHELGRRMGDRNLNRNLRPTAVPQDFEDRIANVLCPLLDAHDVLLDLHSFQGQGEAFVMIGPATTAATSSPLPMPPTSSAGAPPGRAPCGRRLAVGVRSRRGTAPRACPAPGHRCSTPTPATAWAPPSTCAARGGWGMTLECGQHADPQAPEVAYTAIRQTLALLGLADAAPQAARTDHEVLSLVEVTDRLHVDDRFVREWASFDAVRAGEPIAVRHDGHIVAAPADGRIVFPNAKAEPGNEWFYFAQPSQRPLV
jgi:predicted deacylase